LVFRSAAAVTHRDATRNERKPVTQHSERLGANVQ
jgi:hypothetical protein